MQYLPLFQIFLTQFMCICAMLIFLEFEFGGFGGGVAPTQTVGASASIMAKNRFSASK